MAGHRRQKKKGHIYTVHRALFYGVRHTQRKISAGTFQETGAGTELIKRLHEQVYADLYFCHSTAKQLRKLTQLNTRQIRKRVTILSGISPASLRLLMTFSIISRTHCMYVLYLSRKITSTEN
jgi:hypothetical protein